MTTNILRIQRTVILLCVPILVLSGCAGGKSVYSSTSLVDTRTAGVSHTDVTLLTEQMIADLLTAPFVQRYDLPVTISMLRIVNNTSEFVDTDALFGEKIVTALIRDGAGVFEFVDRSLLEETIKEAELGAAGLVSQDETTRLGRAAGVRLLMTGQLTSIRTADRRTDQRYYKLALRLVDTERNTIVWIKEGDIMKVSSRGWMQ